MPIFFLTGATGLLGRYVLRNLLQEGHDVAVLARGGSGSHSARARVDAAIRRFEEELGRTLPRPVVVGGHLHVSGLGLSASDRQWVARNCRSVIHCAASVTFEKDEATNEPFCSNVEGTQRLLEFCDEAGLRELHHVSTAYVCGDRHGRILEDELDCGQRFRNDYEQSKFTAEQLVRAAAWLNSLTVYRPSIIVGDSVTGFSSTFHGFYLPLQLAYCATRAGLLAESSSYMDVLGLRGDERKNLVPVDWVADAITRIGMHPEFHNQTYHLTHSQPLTTADLDAAIAAAIERSNVGNGRGSPAPPASPHSLDQFRQQMQVYAAYLTDDPEFDSRHTTAAGVADCPRLDREKLVQLSRYAIEAGFGWPRRPPQPFVLDVASRMNRLPQFVVGGAASDTQMQLQINGSYGGVWQVWFRAGQLVGVRFGSDRDCDFSGYLNVHTLEDLLSGRQTVRGAIARSHLVLAGRPEQLTQGPELVEDLCHCLSRVQ